ncbi:hypothetical protein F4818DRAFT_454960 [Hypoxylon cercidicola]|nr:hypothetical protein F4818DRAFT_454960 [Hypoxylon cercidicola]
MAQVQPQQPHIPLELVFEIMTCLLPVNEHAIIPLSHPATQALLAFTTVSRATHEDAVKKLKQHCLHIDNSDRLSRFVRCLEASQQSSLGLPSVFQGITSMYLHVSDTYRAYINAVGLFKHFRTSLQRLIVQRDTAPNLIDATRQMSLAIAELPNLEELSCGTDIVDLVVYSRFPFLSIDTWVNRRLFPALKRLGVKSYDNSRMNAPLRWPIVLMPSIELAVLLETCPFDGATTFLTPQLIQQATRTVMIVLAETGRDPEFYSENDIRMIENRGQGYLRAKKHLIPNGESCDNFWLRNSLSGELWDLGDDQQARLPAATNQNEVTEADITDVSNAMNAMNVLDVTENADETEAAEESG